MSGSKNCVTWGRVSSSARQQAWADAASDCAYAFASIGSKRSELDKYLKANTSKEWTHSLQRQGRYWYGCIATMRESSLQPLMKATDSIADEHALLSQIFWGKRGDGSDERVVGILPNRLCHAALGSANQG